MGEPGEKGEGAGRVEQSESRGVSGQEVEHGEQGGGGEGELQERGQMMRRVADRRVEESPVDAERSGRRADVEEGRQGGLGGPGGTTRRRHLTGTLGAELLRGPRPQVLTRRIAARRLTDRDLALVNWLVRFPFATVNQILRRLDAPAGLAKRIPRLEYAGLLDSVSLPLERERAYLVSAEAVSTLTGSGLSAARFDVRSYRHDLAVTDLAITLELAGKTVISEREIRHLEAYGERELAVRPPGVDDTAGRLLARHYPDLVVESDDGRLWAIELDLTPKRNRRLRNILEGYREAAHIAAVVYYVERPGIRRRLWETITDLGMTQRATVREWEPFDYARWVVESAPTGQRIGRAEAREDDRHEPVHDGLVQAASGG